MTNRLNKDVQQHVKKNCATYAGDGRCLLDRPCPFFDESNEGARCLYYENGVLPTDEKLYARYWSRFGLRYWNDSLKTCEQCGKGFNANSNAQKYCDECSDFMKRQRRSAQNRRNYQRKKRG